MRFPSPPPRRLAALASTVKMVTEAKRMSGETGPPHHLTASRRRLDMADDVTVRVMKYEDLDAIAAIDARVLGQSRRQYWEMKVEEAEKRALPSLAAEKNGRVIGFILGDARGWEYGIPETLGWIDAIGVDPRFQNQGVGRRLMEEMIANFRKVGAARVYTLVDWKSWDILRFLASMDFRKGDMINLELKI
jgi:ribosomal protein S18 acetylase RimI-like enzyme